MKNKTLTRHPVLNVVSSTLISLPAPSSLSYMWNWGSILGTILVIQIIRGFMLASHYNARVEYAFGSVIHISREVIDGWFLRFLHINGASFFFMIIFIHIRRGIIFSSFKRKRTWFSGISILFILIGTAFIGYVLPWGQISFWGATVITNLVSAIPYIGSFIVQWLWGGFSVGQATLNRFFAIHFLLPFILSAAIVVHLASLHIKGSNSPTGIKRNLDKIMFHPFFSIKDILGIFLFVYILLVVRIIYPFLMGDPENFNPANPLNTPIHIQPEWYFLFAYAILRSIPNKLGGVIALVLSILIISILPLKSKRRISLKFTPLSKLWFWGFARLFIILTWAGAKPVESPFEEISIIIRRIYFFSISLF